jgi:hypothetical protein
MAELAQAADRRKRSPAYPIIGLGDALEQLEAFDAHFAGNAVYPDEVGDAWGITAKTYSSRMAAALRYFGLLKYQGSGSDRHIVVSNEGRKYLAAQQEEIKREVIRAAALRPAALAKFWSKWRGNRPADGTCLDELVLNNGFTEAGAREFLKVYDATIGFANFGEPDREKASRAKEKWDAGERERSSAFPQETGASRQNGGERELTAGLLSKGSNFRLIVSGPVGVREIERLIAKLRLDQQILAGRKASRNSKERSLALVPFPSARMRSRKL